MADISVSDLQAIAVDCTSRFLNEGVPLSSSLAKQASDRGLNSDQLQRAVEATNTLTYLKTLEVSGDRTSEFPLANFQEIVKQASLPESMLKQAGVVDAPKEFVAGRGFEKSAALAEAALAPSSISVTAPEIHAFLVKEASSNQRRIEDLTGYCEVLHSRLIGTSREAGKDPLVLEKIAQVTQDEESFQKLAMLITGRAQKRPDYAEHLFTKQASSLDTVREAQSLLKEAYEVVAELNDRKQLAARHSELTKQAFLGLLGRGAALLGKGVTQASSLLGKGTGSLIGAGIGGAAKVVTKPAMAAASASKAAANPHGGLAQMLKAKLRDNPLAKAIGVKPIEGPPSPAVRAVRKKIAVGTAIGGMGLDAASYSPKVDPVNDHSGSVWASLQTPQL